MSGSLIDVSYPDAIKHSALFYRFVSFLGQATEAVLAAVGCLPPTPSFLQADDVSRLQQLAVLQATASCCKTASTSLGGWWRSCSRAPSRCSPTLPPATAWSSSCCTTAAWTLPGPLWRGRSTTTWVRSAVLALALLEGSVYNYLSALGCKTSPCALALPEGSVPAVQKSEEQHCHQREGMRLECCCLWVLSSTAKKEGGCVASS